MENSQRGQTRRSWLIFALAIPVATLIVTAIFNLSALKSVQYGLPAFFSIDSPEKWEFYNGDLSVEAEAFARSEGWSSLSGAIDDRKTPSEVYWVRRSLPSNVDTAEGTALHIRRLGHFEAYLNGQIVYSGQLPEGEKPSLFRWNRIPLPESSAGSMLYLRIWGEPSSLVPTAGQIIGGPQEEFLVSILRQDAIRLVMSVCYLFIFILTVCAWLFYERNAAYLYFGCLTLSAGYSALFGTGLFQYYMDMGAFVSYVQIGNPLAAWAIAGLLERLSGGKPSRIFARLRIYYSILIPLAIISSLLSRTVHPTTISLMLLLILLSSPIAILGIYRSYRDRAGETGKISFLVIVLLLSIGAEELYNFMYPRGSRSSNQWSLLIEIVVDNLVLLSLFYLIFGMGFVLVVRARDQLRGMKGRLERKVRERTSDLERTSLQLQASIREKAKAMSDIAMMKERNRISEDIHDHVGHTLTASIVQLEAAMMLLERGDERGLENARQSQALVRKGLDEIREAVHRMKEDNAFELTLQNILAELIENTSETMDVQIDYAIGDLPPMTAAHQRTILQALKEGLTNGIKHGKSKHFRFHLEQRDHHVRFRLRNDGIRYESGKYGFGMQSMNERVMLLGGTLTLSPDHDRGCVLRIDLPLEG